MLQEKVDQDQNRVDQLIFIKNKFLKVKKEK